MESESMFRNPTTDRDRTEGDSTDDRLDSTTEFSRRAYLKLAGIGIVSVSGMPVGTASADSTSGYGEGGYGEGGYGGYEEDDDTAVPEILRFNMDDTSNPRNPHIDLEIEWAATIDDGDLAHAELVVSENGTVVESWQYDLDGSDAEERETKRIDHGAGETYHVTLHVESAHDTNVSDEKTLNT